MKFKKPQFRIPKKFFTLAGLMQVLFFTYLMLMPHTKFSVPSLGKYELTFSDLSVITLLGLYMISNSKMTKLLTKFLYVFLFFLFTMGLTVFVATSYWKLLLGMMPYFFALILTLALLFFFSSYGDKLKAFKAIWYCLVVTLIFSAIPVYVQVLTGAKNLLFWDKVGWRYTFLSQNPNQFGVYFILYIFLITLIALKYFKPKLKYVLLLMIYMLPAVLFSGSRTAMVAAAFVMMVLLFVLFVKASVVQRMTFAPFVLIAVVAALQWVVSFTAEQGGQIKRALSILERVEEKGLAGAAKVGGASGISHGEGIDIYLTHPILGIGLNNKTIVYAGIKNEIHNTYLKILADAGTIGFIGFLMMFFFPLTCVLASRASFLFKFITLASFGLFGIMNIPHMLMRQRWVWFFMIILFVMSQYDSKGNVEKSRLSFLN